MIKNKNNFIFSILFFILLISIKLISFPFFKYHPEDKDKFKSFFHENFDGYKYFSEFIGFPKILISPHANYNFSGKVAARAFNLLKDRYRLVIILGPPHHEYFRGFAIYRGDYLLSPFGKIMIAKKEALMLNKKVRGTFLDKRLFEKEHSINIQTPYIQAVLKHTKILPIIMGDTKKRELDILSKYLEKLTKRNNTLIIVSTDLSHYHKLKTAKEIDSKTIKELEKKRPEQFLRLKKMGIIEACGWRALYIGLKIAKKEKLYFIPVSRGYSSDFDGNTNRVVGYFSGIFYKEEKLKISKDDKEKIIEIVKASIQKREPFEMNFEKSPLLRKRFGVFITLRKNRVFRGCMGALAPKTPLFLTLKEIAYESAYSDKRFKPLQKEEIRELSVKVSLTYNLRQFYNYKNIKIGKDSILIIKGNRRGGLLPEIPLMYHWSKKELLKNTCIKTRLKKKCYKDKNVKIYKFNTYEIKFRF